MACCCKCKNVGDYDRAFRIFVGFIIMGYGIYFNNALLVGISFIPLLTGVMRYCPLYSMCKINTSCKKDDSCSADNSDKCCSTEDKETNKDKTA